MTLCICIAPGPVGSLGAPYGSNRVLPPRRGDLQNPEVEGKSDVGSEATEGRGGLQQELVALEHIGDGDMGTVQHHRDSLQEISALGGEMLACSSLCSHLRGTARPSATRAGRFSVPKGVKEAAMDEKAEPLSWP